jgi:predicted CoA-binding protein
MAEIAEAMNQLRERVDAFMERSRIAFVGVSRDEKSFSRTLYREFAHRGYDLAPVNPAAEEIDGVPAFASLRDVDPPAEAALLMVPKESIKPAIEECADAGVPHVWVYGVGMPDEVSRRAKELAKERNVEIIAGYCPYMFFEDAGVIHRFHAWIMRGIGALPKK